MSAKPFLSADWEEADRLAELARYGILDSPPEEAFDRVTRIAAAAFDAPMALVSLVDRDRQWFKAKVGLCAMETGRDVSFCSHAVAAGAMLVVHDATEDPRFANNPLVIGDPEIRFYAGAPLTTPLGFHLGSLCIIDTTPRPTFGQRERATLTDLAAVVMDQLELRRAELAHSESRERFDRVAASSSDAVICADREGMITFWNAGAERLFGYPRREAIGRPLTLIVPEEARSAHEAAFKRLASGGRPRLIGRTVELEGQTRDGRRVSVELSLSCWPESAGMAFGAIIRDVSARKENEQRLRHLVDHDSLTGLPNRNLLRRRLLRALESAERQCCPAALILIDLDHFKEFNDSLGHTVGDSVLKLAGERLRQCVRENDTVARLSGDEFALLLTGAIDARAAARIADEAIEALAQPSDVDGHRLHLGASAGIALCPDDGETVDALMANADLALYRAKRDGRGRFQFFITDMREQVEIKKRLDGQLHRAVREGELELYYQPQVRLSDGMVVGAEALLRWRHPERGILPPAQFLPVLEASAMAATVGTWVLRTACAQARLWQDAGPRPLRVGINLSNALFRLADFPCLVAEALARENVRPDLIELEVTETILLTHDSRSVELLRRLHELGVAIAFDDFGTGYASLSYLKRFPLDRIKIDRQFVRDINTDADDVAIVRAITALGRSLGLSVIAEGIETAAQEAYLRSLGCEEGQGYRYGRPMPAGDLERLIGRPAEPDRAIA